MNVFWGVRQLKWADADIIKHEHSHLHVRKSWASHKLAFLLLLYLPPLPQFSPILTLRTGTIFLSLLPVIPPITVISHCWVCWLPPHPLYFWRISKRLHHDFVSLLSLSVRLLFLIIPPLFPLYFSSFQPHFPPNSFDCLQVLVCVDVHVYLWVCIFDVMNNMSSGYLCI